ncbi:hypothetical protein MY10362_008784 [Beauveria mimosiformis]
MKFIVPVAFALFGAALAAPVEADVASRSPKGDILYNNAAGWGKRSEETNEAKRSPKGDILYNNAAGWGKRSPKGDILYNNAAGWGKRSEVAEDAA